MIIYHSGTPGIRHALPEILAFAEGGRDVILFFSGGEQYVTGDGKRIGAEHILPEPTVMMSFSESKKLLDKRIRRIIRSRKRGKAK